MNNTMKIEEELKDKLKFALLPALLDLECRKTDVNSVFYLVYQLVAGKIEGDKYAKVDCVNLLKEQIELAKESKEKEIVDKLKKIDIEKWNDAEHCTCLGYAISEITGDEDYHPINNP